MSERKDDKLVRECRVEDASLQVFLNSQLPRKERILTWKHARLKGTTKFQRILDRYARHLAEPPDPPKGGLDYVVRAKGYPHFTVHFMELDLSRIYERAAFGKTRLADVRAAVISMLKDESRRRSPWGDNLREGGSALPDLENARNHQRAEVDDSLWPHLDILTDYYGLLSNPQLLARLGRGLLTDDEINSLATSRPLPPKTVDLEDVAGLCYLYILTYGKNTVFFDHAIVDEAQDFSPLQVQLLRMHCRDKSMTLVGDIAQGIYAYRGISDWSEDTPAVRRWHHSSREHLTELPINARSCCSPMRFSGACTRSAPLRPSPSIVLVQCPAPDSGSVVCLPAWRGRACPQPRPAGANTPEQAVPVAETAGGIRRLTGAGAGGAGHGQRLLGPAAAQQGRQEARHRRITGAGGCCDTPRHERRRPQLAVGPDVHVRRQRRAPWRPWPQPRPCAGRCPACSA